MYIYEVDNRYPEIAPLYEKVKGAKHHGGLHGGAAPAVRRATRINRLKSGFLTAAATVIAVLTLLVSGAGGEAREAFREPEIRIIAAEQSEDALDEILYTYEVLLNSADRVDVTVTARTEDGEILGMDGPFRHVKDGSSDWLTMKISRPMGVSQIELEATGVYTFNGQEQSMNAILNVPLRDEPEPDTEPPTEPDTEPVTEPPTEPVPSSTEAPVAPTLGIESAELNGTDVTPLSYSYRVTMNDAPELEVSAEITDENGKVLGTDGPYTHTADETTPKREIELDWETRPETLTLKLTGTYTENGETKTLEDSMTLSVPEEPFIAPTLSITSARLNGTSVTPLRYAYQVTLNSAESMEVTAKISDQSGRALGEDGPYTHSASESSPERSVALSWASRPKQVELTLTGTFTEKGETKTVTATQTLTVAEEPFTAPTLTITRAALNGTDITPLIYTYRVTLNSASSMQVKATISSNSGEQLGTDGPYSHSASGVSPSRSARLSWRNRPSTVTLTLTGTYTENGKTKTVTASQTLTVTEPPFTAPTLRISSAELNGTDATALRYVYRVTLNSATQMQVRAAVTANGGASLGTGGPYTHTSSGASPTRTVSLSWRTRPTTVTLTLTGTYTEKGQTKTLTATQTVRVPEQPFTAPTLSISSASLNGTGVTPLSYVYRVTLNSATQMQVRAAVTANGGASLGSGGPYTHTSSGASPTRTVNLSWTTRPTSVTLTLTGTYTEKGTTKTVTATQTLSVPEEPFIAPTLAVTDASVASTTSTTSQLSYAYRVTLNSAQNLRVTAAIRSNTNESLGSDGPYTHTSSGVSPTRTTPLSWTTYPQSLTLTLTGTYTEKGTTKTITATRTITMPEQPFTAPTLSILSAELDDTDFSPLSYSYEVNLNSAQSLSVSATVTSDAGVTLGSGGPYQHTANGSSPERSVDLSWTDWPNTLTLKLTGTYTQNGTTKTITAEETLTMPDKPFEGPKLTIESAQSLVYDMQFVYSYSFDLMDAENLKVDAKFTCQEELDDGTVETYEVGVDGPYTHSTGPLTTELITVEAEEYPYELPVTLTLTGTYTDDNGETKTVTDSKVLEVFMSPDVWISSALRDGLDEAVIVYDAYIWPNDADPLTVYFTLRTETEEVKKIGPFTYSGDETVLTEQTIRADGYESEFLILEVTGTYELNGETRTVTDSYAIEGTLLFEKPTLSLLNVERGYTGADEVIYSFGANMNSAELLKVKAQFYDSAENLVYETAVMDVEDEGPFGPYTVSTGEPASSIVLVGEYEHLGSTYYVEAEGPIPDFTPFVAPSFDLPTATLNEYSPGEDVILSCNSRFNIGDATQADVYVKVVSNLGTTVGQSATRNYTSNGIVSEDVLLNLTGNETSLTAIFTCEYNVGSSAQEVTEEVEVVVTMGGYSFTSGGETGWFESSEDEFYGVDYWAEFKPNDADPHKENYDFVVTEFIVFWYESDGTLMESAYVTTETSWIDITYNEGDCIYEFAYLGYLEMPEDAMTAKFQLNVKDQSTGKRYTTTTNMIEVGA